MAKSSYDEVSLLMRNFPNDFTDQDIREFVLLFDPVEVLVSSETHAALARFPTGDHAKYVLTVVHQTDVNGNLLYVEYTQKNTRNIFPIISHFENATSDTVCPNCKVSSQRMDIVTTNIRQLYDIGKYSELSQPIPPHLKYNYPLANHDITTSISDALMNSTQFYIQVLHLMNRMNLEPPFIPNAKDLLYANTNTNTPSLKYISIAVQTDDHIWEQIVKNKRKCLASDESELDTDSSDGRQLEDLLERNTRKRPRLQEDERSKIKRKIQKVLKNHQLIEENQNEKQSMSKDNANQNICSVFDLSSTMEKPYGIKIVAPSAVAFVSTIVDEHEPRFQVDPNNSSPANAQINPESSDVVAHAAIAIMPEEQLKENRIPSDKLPSHPLFQNYSSGDISNKLYIKNIAKEVTEDDLKSVYHRYLKKHADKESNVHTIDIRLMATGRMKGQAFVTFSGPYMEDDDITPKEKYRVVEKARRETNGLILKSKPIVVSFGKINK